MGKKDADAPPKEAGGGNINQIRDILIGPFQRDQEARFDRVEQSLQRAAGEAADATARAQEKLQKSLDAAVDGLEAKLSDLSKRMTDLDDTRKREAAAMAEDLTRQLRELETKLGAELRELDRHTEERLRGVRSDMDAALAVLRDEKTSRHDLGDYLMELGLRLKGEASLSALDSSLEEAIGGASKDS